MKKRYIITKDYYQLFECDSYAEIGRFLGCTRQNISKQLKTNISYIVVKGIKYHILDRLAYDYHEARQYKNI
jgi:hypothetical protein